MQKLNLVTITFRCSKKFREKIRNYAKSNKLLVSAVIRKALKEYFDHNENTIPSLIELETSEVCISAKISKDMVQKINEVCQRYKISKSEFIRYVIEKYISTH